MLIFITSLYFNGNCEEAFNFYKSIFGGEFRFIVRHNDPSLKNTNLSKENSNKISCILYQTGQGTLLGEDVLDPDNIRQNKKNNTAITIHPDTKEDAGKIFNALSAGGEIKIPITDKINDYIGSLTDKFGISWRVWWFDQTQVQGTAAKEENKTGELFERRDMSNSAFREVIMKNAKFDFDNLDGASFDKVYMPNVNFKNTGLNQAVFSCSNLENAIITNDTLISNMKISNCLYDGLTIDGIEVQPLVEAEKDRLDPERKRLRISNPFDPSEVMKVMKRLDEVREEFYKLLRSTPHKQLIAKPEGIDRWSALEHMRHLVGAEDAYLNRRLLNNDKPVFKFGKQPHFIEADPSRAVIGNEPTEDLDIVLRAWDEIHTDMKKYLSKITPEILKHEVNDNIVGTITAGAALQILPTHDLLHIRMAQKAIEDLNSIN